ncbi:nicotinate-nucleotide pyrophosphorylase (carboxylating) [[Clostridium] fimetarium]|uniref:Probable nicotinate-nucleotide pyrophosphorylase [carboxylating] n=1 Tax=[Clostridium] fimetarium TaxID=99656 RepID=A0A1I0MG97_9FIRM|nr:carboxylating nicotinate-nucleotide diphosphorylase [[Clostridium] fimetarium]SEV86984.1 nicotinate-nucleotide pyrophosphorylase (carboxylating) [[Clostridium] fimetarium]
MINGVTLKLNMDDYILNALKEDITSEDVSTNAVMREYVVGEAELICKEDGIICGLEVFERVFTLLDEQIEFDCKFIDGQSVQKGQLIGILHGDIRVLLSGERTALNYLQRMSGIATFTKSYVDELKGYRTKLLDTRKTTPNNRIFEKYAVTVGGGCNHRYNLSDGVLLKDNHIGAAGSVTKAILMAKEYAPFVRKIEVEVETLEMVREAVAAGADIIMLDNMDNATMRRALEIIDGKAQTECSGNVTIERLKEIAQIGVDFVSSGALTHSAPIMDISLKNLRPVE